MPQRRLGLHQETFCLKEKAFSLKDVLWSTRKFEAMTRQMLRKFEPKTLLATVVTGERHGLLTAVFLPPQILFCRWCLGVVGL